MNIWNKVFLGLLVVLGIAAWFFASNEFTIRSRGQKAVASLQEQIPAEEKKVQKVRQGSAPGKALKDKNLDEMGLDDIQIELQNLLYEQKKAWFGCVPGAVKADGRTVPVEQLGDNLETTAEDKLKPVKLLEVKLTITGPTIEKEGAQEVIPPDGLMGLVYVFDEGVRAEEDAPATGGAFLGIFTVEGADKLVKVPKGYQVTLVSAVELNEVEVQRIEKLAKATSNWAVYVAVPQDLLSERALHLSNLLDEKSREALKGDIDRLLTPERKALDLKDFGELLKRNYDLRVELKRDIEKAKSDIVSLSASLEIAKKEDAKLRDDKDFENKRIAAMELQRDAIQKKNEEYDAMIKLLNEGIAKAQQQNEWYVARIAEYQLEVKKVIEQRTEQ